MEKTIIKILQAFIPDYKAEFTIRALTIKQRLSYSHAWKVMNSMKGILTQRKQGQATLVALNLTPQAIRLMCYVEENIPHHNPSLDLLIKEAIIVDPAVCVGIFGSRADHTARKDSDWDIFIISDNEAMQHIGRVLPFAKDLHLNIFSCKEFSESIASTEDNVVKYLVRNKQIIYNAHVFYGMMLAWELRNYLHRR